MSNYVQQEIVAIEISYYKREVSLSFWLLLTNFISTCLQIYYSYRHDTSGNSNKILLFTVWNFTIQMRTPSQHRKNKEKKTLEGQNSTKRMFVQKCINLQICQKQHGLNLNFLRFTYSVFLLLCRQSKNSNKEIPKVLAYQINIYLSKILVKVYFFTRRFLRNI